MLNNKIKYCKLIANRNIDDNDVGDIHFRICETQFVRSSYHLYIFKKLFPDIVCDFFLCFFFEFISFCLCLT